MVTKEKSKKTNTNTPPECWVDKQPVKSKKKLYGIWAKYNTATKSKIEKECKIRGTGQGHKKRKGK